MFAKVIFSAAVLSAVLGGPVKPQQGYQVPQNQYFQPQPSYSQPRPTYEEPEDAVPSYSSYWKVNDDYSGNNFGHKETREDDRTEGHYYVQLPDGRLQKVTYYVDGDSGFVAEVSYEGEAKYPENKPTYKPQPTYQAQPTYQPQPTYQKPKSPYGF